MKTSRKFSSAELSDIKQKISEHTGYYLMNLCILQQAFTRKSYTADRRENNESFEFIGDSVIGYYATRFIAERFGGLNEDRTFSSRITEKDLAGIRSRLVSNAHFAELIDEWDIAKYLVVGREDTELSVKHRADLFEAIIGAIAIHCSWQENKLRPVVERALHVEEFLSTVHREEYRPTEFRAENAVQTLKELEEKGLIRVRYSVDPPDILGYEQNGDPIWRVHCIVSEWGLIRAVTAGSKRLAKRFAAYLVLAERYELPNEYGVNRSLMFWEYRNGTLMPSTVEDLDRGIQRPSRPPRS